MPYVIKKGQRIYFPFHPDKVARALSEGYKVEPDEGLSEAELKMHRLLINQSLNRIWANQNLRTTPGRFDMPAWKNEQNVAPEMHLPNINRGAGFMSVEPNPARNYSLRVIPNTTRFDILAPARGLMDL